MDSSSALEEEALAIVSIYGPSSFYALTQPAATAAAQQQQDTPVYALKASLEEPDLDFDLTTTDHQQDTPGHKDTPSLGRVRKELEFRIYFPKGYPETNTSAPVHEIVSIYYGSLRLTDTIIQEIYQGLEQCFVPGEVVVFSWIEWLRSFLEELEELETRTQKEDIRGHTGMRRNRDDAEDEGGEDEDKDEDDENDELHASENQKAASDYFAADTHGPGTLSSLESLSLHPSASTDTDSLRAPRPSGVPAFKIQSGQPIVDRKSVFVAHLAPITQPVQVPWMIVQLKQENKKVVKATHNIMAYRVENENGTISQDNDDDGETAAGSRLLHLMSILDVRNVVVVVSRWYGGIPLSADRFKHINNAARQLLDECGYIKPSASAESTSGANKKKSKGRKAGK
ncbi:ribosomal protein S5 domain 2-type protein [Mortierella sp. GBAus27b]|nr:hypothetical protein BGX31_002961 [Mortierella sp. GBA43]KAI8351116.1 ribosomal protein S5 domain 2-type protein [Mortierella sp. GBAus27b]